MDKRIIYVSYATINTPYVKVIEKYLLPTLQKFNLTYDITYPEHMGSWQKNTQYKATFLKEMLLKHQQPLVFLDADATIEKYPELFDTLFTSDYDIGAHYFDTDYFWRGFVGSPNREILSGTLFLNYNDKILKFIDEWIIENTKQDILEQKCMQIVLKRYSDTLKIYSLPIQYVAIVKQNQIVPSFITNPVIIHHQVSREYKNWGRR